MDFREFAANEASQLTKRLTEAATAATERAVTQARDEERKVAETLRGQVQALNKEKAAATAQLKDTHAQAERLQGELKATAERVEVASRQLDEARKTAAKLEAARTELTAARDEQTAARRTAETDLRSTRETVETLRAEIASAMKTLEKAAAERMASEEAAAGAHSQAQAAEAKLSAVTDLLKTHASRVKALEQSEQDYQRQIQALQAKAQQAAAAPPPAPATGTLDDLLAGFHALAGAATINDVLTTLVEQMAAQFPRVALFRVKKGHLQGEHQIGFDLKTDINKLVLPLGMDSLPARAVSSGQIESLVGEELKDSKRTPFSGTPSAAVALPLIVAGETLAVVYADDSGARGTAGRDIRPRHAEALQRYSLALLARLTNELKALAELRQYAASLLHEMEQMYTADVESGLTGDDLQQRLAGNLDFARSIYGSRTALEGADAATLIDDELQALLEVRQGTPFARDLGAAAGHARENKAAEAS